ncbi:MAG: DUF3231 family protein [Firmicutes bacterium]|jgi:hypothetical protein|nr:DUF3231 family protein [Bacillota bacterium]
MILTRFVRREGCQKLIDAREAANLWDIAISKHMILEYQQTAQHLAKDLDLKWLLGVMIKANERTIHTLEVVMEKYLVRSPDRNRLPSNWAGNTESFRDEQIGQTNLRFLQEYLENLLRVIRTSTTNDGIRTLFGRFLKTALNDIDLILNYLKLKGWLEIGPYYLNTPPDVKEKITAAEASNLWDHLTFRYDNIRKTNLYLAVTHDFNFKIIIAKGLDRLNRQTGILEQECQKYGISLPKRPPEVVILPVGTDYMCDDQMYRDILQGLQAAAMMHAETSKQCIHNDRIRKLFNNMLLTEVNYYNLFIKYGKQKGWLHAAPAYRSN